MSQEGHTYFFRRNHNKTKMNGSELYSSIRCQEEIKQNFSIFFFVGDVFICLCVCVFVCLLICLFVVFCLFVF